VKYLSREAALHYLALVRVSYFVGLIDWSEAMDRLSSLRVMCAPAESTYEYVSRVLQLEQYELIDDWNETETGDQASDSGIAGQIHVTEEGDDDFRIFLIPGPATGHRVARLQPRDVFLGRDND
jgi:hypothetical protein